MSHHVASACSCSGTPGWWNTACFAHGLVPEAPCAKTNQYFPEGPRGKRLQVAFVLLRVSLVMTGLANAIDKKSVLPDTMTRCR